MTNSILQLKFFELVLLGCGIILFLVLTILLIVQHSKGKPILSLFLFFTFPIAMIGFPSIQSIKFSKDQIEIVTKTQEVEQNPADTVASKELERLLQDVDHERVRQSADALKNIARAHSALGNYDTALVVLDKAINLDKDDGEAQKLRTVVEERRVEKQNFESGIERIREIIRTNDNVSAGDVDSVSRILNTMKAPVYIDKQSALTLAKAYAVVNEKEKALEEVAKITEIQPEHTAAITLQKELASDTTQTSPALTPQERSKLRNSEIFRARKNRLVVRP